MLRLFTLLAGPVFAKEMIELARGRRHYLTRVLYGLGLLAAVALAWLVVYGTWSGGHPDSIAQRARMGEQLFRQVCVVQVAAILVLTPVFLSGAIAGEREEAKFDALLLTWLTDREIVLGKLLSRSLILFLVILTAAPVLGLFILFGGVDPLSMVRAVVAQATVLLFTAAECLYLSAKSHNAVTALLRTYWRLTILLFALPAAVLTVDHTLLATPKTPEQTLLVVLVGVLNPVSSVFLAVDGFAYKQAGLPVFIVTVTLPTAWAVYRIWRAVVHVRQPRDWFYLLVRRWALHIRDWLYAHTNLEGEIQDELDRLQREFPNVGRPVSNPLWQRARRCHVYDRHRYARWTQMAVGLAVLIFQGMLIVAERRDFVSLYALPAVAVLWGVLLMLVGVLAASSIVGDRRRGFFDLVLLTPLSGRSVVDGVLGAIWEHIRWFAPVPVVFTFLNSLAGTPSFFGFLSMMLIGTLFCALCMVSGLTFSLAARTPAGALTALAAFLVVAEFLLPALTAALRGSALTGLTILSLLVLGSSILWQLRKPGLIPVCCLLSAGYVVLTCLALGWSSLTNSDGVTKPALLLGPWQILLLPVSDPRADWEGPAVLFAFALAGSVGAGHWLVVHQFDRLAARTP
jgi:hypothetical protein